MTADQREVLLIAEQAADWLQRLQTAGTEEHASFARWVRLSPLHVREILLAQRCDAPLSRIDPDRRVDVDALIAQCSNNVIPVQTNRVADADGPPLRDQRPWSIAAVVAAIILVPMFTFMLKVVLFDPVAATRASEWETRMLADGSVVHLGPNTRLRIEFGDSRRVVHLQRGEAYFEVAKDSARPFSVITEPGVARAVGTAFGVDHHNNETTVVVREGIVAVSPNNHAIRSRTGGESGSTPQTGSLSVSAGRQVSIARMWPVPVMPANVEHELAWVNRRLIFNEGDTVKRAIDEFNRRNLEQIELDDVELGARQIRGIFDASNPEAIAEFVVHIAHATLVREKRGVLRIELERRNSTSAPTEL